MTPQGPNCLNLGLTSCSSFSDTSLYSRTSSTPPSGLLLHMSISRSVVQSHHHTDAGITSEGPHNGRGQVYRIADNLGTPSLDLISLEHRTAALHQRLQEFLDAQAVGLSAGFETSEQPNVHEGLSFTSQNISQFKMVPVRQPPHEQTSLGAARRGICVAMQELSKVKGDELEVIDTSLQQNRAVAKRLDEWEKKRHGLDVEIVAIKKSPAGSRMQQLQDQNRKLREETNAMELQLLELKARQRTVQIELSSLTNSVQSEISSYEASRRLLDRQIQEFLAKPPEPLPGIEAGPAYASNALSRRTILMVREQTQQNERVLANRRTRIENEKTALEDGVEVWSTVVSQITEFERHLARCLKSSKFSPSCDVDADNTDSGRIERHIIDLELRFKQILAYLDTEVKIAESHGWKLLLCSIGAEMEALVQGYKILEATLFAATTL